MGVNMTINIEYETQKTLSFDYKALIQKVIGQALEHEQCPYEPEVNVVITDNDEIQMINKEYREIDAPTDVLSFPMIDYTEPSDFSKLEQEIESYFNPETGELILGDIMISIDKVFEQAELYGHTVERELAFLVAHSMLHLCGYDHMDEEERKIMEAKQDEILTQLNINR